MLRKKPLEISLRFFASFSINFVVGTNFVILASCGLLAYNLLKHRGGFMGLCSHRSFKACIRFCYDYFDFN